MWIIDLLSTFFDIFLPWLLGQTIDELSSTPTNWKIVCIFVTCELLFIFIQYYDQRKSNRVYNNILENESLKYFENTLQSDLSDSTIASRIDRVTVLTDFLCVDFPNIATSVLVIISGLFYIFININWILGIKTIVISTIILIVTQKTKMKIIQTDEDKKDLEEKTLNVLSKRDIGMYKNHLKKIINSNILSSDKESNVYLISSLIQLFLLVVTIVFLFISGNYSLGILYAAITYIERLNVEVLNINEYILVIKNLLNDTIRLNYNCKTINR